ncbi:MAG: sel1 repeat family protein [Caulobacteraceae bacterium]|nr:sel1 repeat family protein [Caulobacteraceae bacterium]
MRAVILASILLLGAASPALAQAPTPPDAATQYRDMKTRAEAGDAEAQWNLGMMLLNGEGTTRNEREAWRWVRASGDAGYENGMISTAVMLALGQGTTRDEAQARDWYRRAAERHRSAHALRGYAGMLIMGQGGPQEAERGLAYLELAGEGGDENALRILDAIAPQVAGRIDRPRVDALKAEWVAARGRPD